MATIKICDVCKARHILRETNRFWRWPGNGRIDVCDHCDPEVRLRVKSLKWTKLEIEAWIRVGADPKQIERPTFRFVKIEPPPPNDRGI